MPPEALRGPHRLGGDEIDRLNRVFSEAFTDRYQRDGMSGVRVPQLNPAIWRYALADAGEDALGWRDGAGELVAFNLVHRCGIEGWMGPLAVRPDRQGAGIGSTIVREGIRRLEAAGARIIGLETMPRTVDNIGFYSGLGFRPGHLTVSVVRELAGAAGEFGALLSRGNRAAGLAACRTLTARVSPGVDFTRQIELTLDQGLGDVTFLDGGKGLEAFALWQAAPLAEGRAHDEVRVLKLVAESRAAFSRLVAAVEGAAASGKSRRVSFRCQTAQREAYGTLLDAGYAVHWTDLRMTLAGREEPAPAGGGVLFSNWEI